MRFATPTLFLILLDTCLGASDKSPHPHQGVIKPFQLGKPNVKLSSADLKQVDVGKMFIAQTVAADGLSGRSTAVQSIHAPPKTIWKQLLDFNSYPSKVDKLSECKVYKDEKTGMDGSRRIKCRFLINAAPGFKYEYYCDHTYSPPKKSLIWSLDYDRDSDFDDVQGHWYVCAHPSKENWSQVYYSADLKLKQWVPKFILNILTTSALKTAVTWVKRESEADWERTGSTAAAKFPKFGFKKPVPVPVVEAPPERRAPGAVKVAVIASSAAVVTAAAVYTAVNMVRDSDSDPDSQ